MKHFYIDYKDYKAICYNSKTKGRYVISWDVIFEFKFDESFMTKNHKAIKELFLFNSLEKYRLSREL